MFVALVTATFLLPAPATAQLWLWEPAPAPAPAPAPDPTPPPPTRRPTAPPPTLPTGGNFINYIDKEPDWLLGKCEGDCDRDEVRLLFGDRQSYSQFFVLRLRMSHIYFILLFALLALF